MRKCCKDTGFCGRLFASRVMPSSPSLTAGRGSSFSREQVGTVPLNSFVGRALAQARKVYDVCGVLGSPEKDIEAATKFKAAGHYCSSPFVKEDCPHCSCEQQPCLWLQENYWPGFQAAGLPF